jgi:hypothetical protein
MGYRRCWIALGVCGLLLAPLSAVAHHAIQGQFDFQKPIELKGTLQKMEWINPHSQMKLEVTNADGTKTLWSFETIAPTKLREKGLGRASEGGFQVGQTYVASGFAARNGNAFAFLKSVKFPDGRVITLWFGDPNGN